MNCQATTKSGDPCKGTALDGSDFCFAHQPRPAEADPQTEPTAELCGHINRHYVGDNVMTCDLEPGHEGPHHAKYFTTDYVAGEITFAGEKDTHWSDMAGTPVDQINPDYESLARMLEDQRVAKLAEQLKRTG